MRARQAVASSRADSACWWRRAPASMTPRSAGSVTRRSPCPFMFEFSERSSVRWRSGRECVYTSPTGRLEGTRSCADVPTDGYRRCDELVAAPTKEASTVSRRTTPPFRADHVGSLLRPPQLFRARADLAAGAIDAAELRAIEDAAIREVVTMQEDVGLQAATDGELRRASWHMDFIFQLDGITKEVGDAPVQFHNERGDIEFTPAALHVDGKLGVSKTIFGDDFTFLKETVATAVPKLTIPSPSMVHYRGGKASIDESVYPELAAFWADLTAAYRDEVRRLGELGCTYLQVDDTSLAYMNDPHPVSYT